MTSNAPHKFVLIEQSMRKVGGHYHEYAVEILRAAESAGYEPVLAINRHFQEFSSLPEQWRVFPVFPYVSDRIHRIPSAESFAVFRRLLAAGRSWRAIAYHVIDALADRIKASISGLRWYRRMVRVRGFAAACEQLFQQMELRPGDQVFCPTMSDMDLLGLVRFLSRFPESAQADWHVQFHLKIYAGREPDYDGQEHAVRQLRRRFAAALGRVPRHRLYFYTTTEQLARQYRRLRVADFQTLPWPVSERFYCRDGTEKQRQRLRLVVAGAVRREKGGNQLSSLVRQIQPDLIETRQVQLLIQADQKPRTQAVLSLPRDRITTSLAVDPSEIPDAPIVSLPHPLDPARYATLIRNADIGLLMYGADEYYVRCSGILVEFLAAGVPVIGPGGCWIGDQIERINLRYLKRVRHEAPAVRCWAAKDLDWTADTNLWLTPSRTRNVSTFQSKWASADIELPVPNGNGDLLICFDWRQPSAAGSYLRCRLEQFDDHGKTTGSFDRVVGAGTKHVDLQTGASVAPATNIRHAIALFPLRSTTRWVRLSLRSGYQNGLITLDDLQVSCLAPADTVSGHRPQGYVGLTAVDPQQAADLVREMTSHYEHYRNGARQFAPTWRDEHAPFQTIQRLGARSGTSFPRRARMAS